MEKELIDKDYTNNIVNIVDNQSLPIEVSKLLLDSYEEIKPLISVTGGTVEFVSVLMSKLGEIEQKIKVSQGTSVPTHES